MSGSWAVINNVPLFQSQVVIMPDISHQDLGHVLRYAYTGSLQLPHAALPSFLRTAAILRLAGVSLEEAEAADTGPQDLSMKPPPEKKIKVEPLETGQASSPSLPSPAHDSKPETFLRKTLLTFPAPSALCSSSHPALVTPRPGRLPPSSSVQENKQAPGGSSSKLPNWSQSQLQDAIESVITQKLRFTQASARYGIPKGTLYDNILGKSKWMQVLDQVGLSEAQEVSVLEFCCEISSMPYNRRTSKSLADIIAFITEVKSKEAGGDFQLSMRQGFKWWWAFTKKHNIISLYYQEADADTIQAGRNSKSNNNRSREKEDHRVASPDNLLNLINNPTSIPINIPTSNFLPFLGLNNHSKYSLQHPDFSIPSHSAAANIM